MNIYTILLWLHIASGTVALVSGLLAIVFKKGRGRHSTSGLVYVAAMYAIGISSVLMATMKFNPFLLSIGVFASYLTYTGKRAIFYWTLKQPCTPGFKEKAPSVIGFITGLCMVGYAITTMIKTGEMFAIPLIVFGGILLMMSISDRKMFSNPDNYKPRNSKWLLLHIRMMGAAYISTVTAFVVVNIQFSPGWVPWLAPTVIGSILITRASAKWAKKLNKGSKAQTVS